MIIGIQGGKGSSNEKACNEFCRKLNIHNYQIKYLISTENVLKELDQGKIDLGTFAVKSSRMGLVKETQEAIKKYPFKKIDEIDLKIDHAFLGVKKLNKGQYSRIISHPQALKEHKEYIQKQYPNAKLIEAKDTALAARRLKEGKYGCKTLIIFPKASAKIYQLKVIEDNLPTNKGYNTTFYLVKKQ
ncbi:MAG: prephenate dehydratase domain-containing protein [Pseudomonadota bacterium]